MIMTAINGLALVTGATSDLGYELADQLARHGYDLIVTDEDDVDIVAAALAVHGTDVEPVRADLRQSEDLELLHRRVIGGPRPVAVAALSAEVGRGYVDDGSLDSALDVVDLSVRATVRLAQLLLTDMLGRGSGRLLLATSAGRELHGFRRAMYASSRSFLRSFAEMAHDLAQGTVGQADVSVMALTPSRSSREDPARVAEAGVDALVNGHRPAPGVRTLSAMATLALRLLPANLRTLVGQAISAPA